MFDRDSWWMWAVLAVLVMSHLSGQRAEADCETACHDAGFAEHRLVPGGEVLRVGLLQVP